MSETEAANVLLQDGPVEEVAAEETTTAVEETTGGATETTADAQPSDSEPEEQKHKRLGGWQRQIQKLKRDNETLLELVRTRPQAEEKPKPVADEEEPKLPKLANFSGTMEEFDKQVEEFPAKLAKYIEKKQQAQTVAKQTETSVAALNEKVAELPELPAMQKAAQESKMSTRLANFMVVEAAKKTNGPEVLREALLDKEIREELVALDKANDGQAIGVLLNTISYGLRIANRNAAATKEKALPQTTAPAPPTLVKRTTGSKEVDLNDPNLSYEDFVKAREAKLKAK